MNILQCECPLPPRQRHRDRECGHRASQRVQCPVLPLRVLNTLEVLLCSTKSHRTQRTPSTEKVRCAGSAAMCCMFQGKIGRSVPPFFNSDPWASASPSLKFSELLSATTSTPMTPRAGERSSPGTIKGIKYKAEGAGFSDKRDGPPAPAPFTCGCARLRPCAATTRPLPCHRKQTPQQRAGRCWLCSAGRPAAGH